MSCFRKDMEVLTIKGEVPIETLAKYKNPVIVWNGKKWIKASFYQTNKSAIIYYIYLRYNHDCYIEKSFIACTEYTQFRFKGQLKTLYELYYDYKATEFDKYLLPIETVEKTTEYIKTQAFIEEIKRADYCMTYGSDADALIINNILVY